MARAPLRRPARDAPIGSGGTRQNGRILGGAVRSGERPRSRRGGPDMGDDSRRSARAGRRAGPATLTPPVGLPATPDGVVDPCVCRHGRDVHEHWRRGTDCGVCGRERCAAFRPEGGRLRRLLRRRAR